jgi:hypothetical protein
MPFDVGGLIIDSAKVLPADGSSSDRPARSGMDLVRNYPDKSSGLYWIQSEKMPNPLQMYVDMTEEGGGYDFYPIQNGTSVWTVFGDVAGANSPNNDGIELGLDLWYPRSPQHWRAAVNFVSDVLGETGTNFQRYFRTAGPVYRDNSTDSGAGDDVNYSTSGGNPQVMRNPIYYGTGAVDWKVPDGGRWWLRDTTFSEPNGDYLNYGFLAITANRVVYNTGALGRVGSTGYAISESYNLQDISFNDIANGFHHETGGYYLVSTNLKG